MKPILKWAGGKSRLMPRLRPFLPAADCLVEPFVGGASVFLDTDYRRYVLADINPDLINFYQAVVDSPEGVIQAALPLFKHANTSADYFRYRTDFAQWRATRGLNRAAVFLYLNRHGYNGLCRYNLRGEFNVPYGRYKNLIFPQRKSACLPKKPAIPIPGLSACPLKKRWRSMSMNAAQCMPTRLIYRLKTEMASRVITSRRFGTKSIRRWLMPWRKPTCAGTSLSCFRAAILPRPTPPIVVLRFTTRTPITASPPRGLAGVKPGK
ncbi:hypothetical protein SODG_002737 [Sodalis praecaptivus]